MDSFEQAISSLDHRLFSAIESQTTSSDKDSLLAIQAAVRHYAGEYRYLEIGSYLGGSIQPHLVDHKCIEIVSIDKRPKIQPDERGFDWTYLNNSTERMLDNLKGIDSSAVAKVVTLDGGTDEIKAEQIDGPIHLCLIDGEHTDDAMKRDFEFCRRVLDPKGGVIVFHDAQITYNGIYECIEALKQEGADFRAYSLPSVVFVIEFGDCNIHKSPEIMKRLINNHESYLFCLRENDRFRRFANRYPFRVMRNVYAKLRNGNRSE